MTKEELRDYYKIIERNKVNDDIEVIDLYNAERSNNLNVRLLFAYNKLYYTGDMGSYIFGNTIHHIKTFFRGSHINPYYWREKVEAYSEPLIGIDISYDKIVDEVNEFLKNYEELFTDSNLDEYTDEVKNAIWLFHNSLESNGYRAYDQITELFDELEIIYGSEDVANIIRSCQDYNYRFLYACELIQWVENEILTWDDVNGI